MILHVVSKIYKKNILLTASIHIKCNGSLLCFAQFMEREIAIKQKHVGGKW